MISTHQHIAFLCGHFKMFGVPSGQQLTHLGWEKFHLPEDIRKIEKRFFYPSLLISAMQMRRTAVVSDM